MIVMGIDASLTSTGVVVLDGDNILLSRAIVTKPGDYQRDILRLMAICDEIEKILHHSNPHRIAIEGFSMGSKGRAVYSIGMLGGIIRQMLQGWEDELVYTWQEVPPTTLKKFITGKGTAKKEDMKLYIFKRWGVEFKTSDEADAYSLARYAQEVKA